MRFRLATLGCVAAVATAGLAMPASATAGGGTSPTWAGYEVTTATPAIHAVTATWTVPALTCPPTGGSRENTLVGMGGVQAGDTLYEIGTTGFCTKGKVGYFAYYKVLPGTLGQNLKNPVVAGDQIVAQIQNAARQTGTVLVTVQDFDATGNSKWSVRASLFVGSTAPLSQSAECVVERQLKGNNVYANLANFGTENFAAGGCKATDVKGNSAQLSQASPLPSGWTQVGLTMVDSAAQTMASPSAPSDSSPLAVTFVRAS